MTPYQFADKYLVEYKQKGSEIIPTYCPICRGGKNGDKYTFALNVDKLTYNCKRGSCGAAGTFWQLCKEFGEIEDREYEFRSPAPKKYVYPKVKTNVAGSKVEEYLKKRGFSKKTWEYWGVAEHNGNIAFPYYDENNKLVLMKYRKPEKYTGNGPKAWREKGGKPVFWGMNKCDLSKPFLVIVEGEMDAIALTEAGVNNVVSVPSGAEDLTCVETCWDWLAQFKKIMIWPDNDEPGQEMARKLINKLGAWRCHLIPSKYKDANEALYRGGIDEIKNSMLHVKEVPIAGLIRLADVKAFDISSVPRVRSSVRALNNIIGGYFEGLLSVWTGVNASGKSTFLGQELLAAIDEGHRVCAFSGEMPMPVFRYWVDLQAAGPDNLQAEFDDYRETDVYKPKTEVLGLIREWYRDKFFVFDSFGEITSDNLLEVFTYASMRYGCKIFLIDNLMLMTYGGDDFYRKQSEFVKKVKKFADQNECHVHLVAHPRKTIGRLTKMDVMGSGDITNLADNVFSVYRLTDEEKNKENCDNYIDVFKNRYSGKQDVSVAVNFEYKSKRFYMPEGKEMLFKQFGWVKRM